MTLKIHTSLTEQNLISGCRKRDQKTQRALYERYAGTMLGLCRRYVSDLHDAEGVMIGGFIKVFDKIDQYEGQGSFEGWMRRIMVNEALGHIRKYKNMYVVEDVERAEAEPDWNTIEQSLQAEDLMRLIGELPPGYKAVFNLYAIEGYSHKEIADMLQISENTSKSQLSRARVHLQGKLLKMESDISRKAVVKDD
jgi:RNA polymerase sigma-70 factor (ECF subfamily)